MDLCPTFVAVGELWKWAELRRWKPRERVELVDFPVAIGIRSAAASRNFPTGGHMPTAWCGRSVS